MTSSDWRSISTTGEVDASMPLLDVRNLRTHYVTHRGIVRSVDDVSFELSEGEFMGLVGESGCGKSTTAYSIMGLVPPPGKVVGGHILFQSNDLVSMNELSLSRMRWKHISMIFQQAMNAFNPVMRVGDQIAESMLIHDKQVTKNVAGERTERLFKLVGLDVNRMSAYPFEFSGGMRQRAMIAMALSCSPDLVIADEPTTALDVSIQAQIIDLLKNLRKEFKMSLLLITHDLSVIAEICDKVAIMYAGKIVEKADVLSIFKQPVHPYTKGLIMAIPSMERGKSKTLFSIAGKPPDLLNPPSGCRFVDRCPRASEICHTDEPIPENYGGVACHFADEMRELTNEEVWSS